MRPATVLIPLVFVLSACTGRAFVQQPLTPQQQAFAQQQAYCELQATAAQEGFAAQQNQSTVATSGFYSGLVQGRAQDTIYRAAYAQCMKAAE